jgi:hypothetical protein
MREGVSNQTIRSSIVRPSFRYATIGEIFDGQTSRTSLTRAPLVTERKFVVPTFGATNYFHPKLLHIKVDENDAGYTTLPEAYKSRNMRSCPQWRPLSDNMTLQKL